MKPSPQAAPKLRRVCRSLAAAVLAWLAACAVAKNPAPEPQAEAGASEGVDVIAEATPDPAAANAPSAEEMARYELAAAYSAARSGRMLLVLRGDEVVFESAQHGFASREAHLLDSASGSFWGVLAAAADADGLLDLDEPVAFTIPEFESDPWKRELRIRQLLNGTSGIAPGTREMRRYRTENLFKRALKLEMVARPGDSFQYSPSSLFVFAEVLRRKLDSRRKDAIDYLEERILDRIGLAVVSWERDQSGNRDVAFGARITAREWAKLGILVKNRGRWQGRRILPEASIAAVTRGSRVSPEYGLGWWLNHSKKTMGVTSPTFYPGGLRDMVVAAGVGNQRLYVIPSLDLVVVRFGKPHGHWLDREFLARLVDGRVE
jgi:CubicO group peptidase (beta-lactamase class C family)